MSRRRSRTLNKAAGTSPASRGSTWTDAQVLAILRATQNVNGGQAAVPLPRLDPQVPFGPGVPLLPAPINPLRPDTGRPEPRAYEYPVTFNLPGFGDRVVPWKVLRDAADMITLFRRCIEIRKAEVATLDWDVVISAKAVERAQRQDPGSARSDIEKAMRERVDPHIGRLVDFWEQPDPRNGHDFIAWASKVLEEYFVLDAIAVYPRLRRDGKLFGFEVLDGTTIKPLLDADGFRPFPPNAAYQQILYGFPRGEFTADGEQDPDNGLVPGGYPADRLVYKVHNVRSWTPYGFSAVEQALADGDLYLRRMDWLKSEYTDGVMPAGWLLAGEGQAEWSPQQLAAYERQFNDFYAGNSAARMRFRLLPYGMTPDDSRTDLGERYRPDYDLHLIKLVAGHFDTTIAELGFTETGGLGSTGWHEGQADVQDRKATQPTLRRLQALCTQMMRTYLNAPAELEFRILGLESEDEDAADEVANRRIGSARMTLNEDRDRTGLPRYPFAEADMPMLVTQRGIVFIEGSSELAKPGEMISPAMGVPIGSDDPSEAEPGAEGSPGSTDPAKPGQPAPPAKPGAAAGPDPDAVKAELVAYRRWATKRAGKPGGRPFRFETITKAQAAAAGIALDGAEFLAKAEGGDPVTAPKVRHWPGWERDLAVAEHWAPILLAASTGLVSARRLVADATTAWKRGGAKAVARTLAGHDYAKAFRPALHGLWTDGFVVGAISSRAVLAHHGMVVKAAQQPDLVTLGADWGTWVPGDLEAAREILEREGLLDGLLELLDTGDTIADSIMVARLDALAGALIAGLEAGDPPAKIAAALRAINADPRWAYRVAVTETTRAVSSATLLRYGRNGIAAKEWATAADQRVCSVCNINQDTGAVLLANPFPSGDDAPPGHPLCRCSLYPALQSVSEAMAEGYSLTDLAALVGQEDLGATVTRTAQEILGDEEAAAAAEEDYLAAFEAEVARIEAAYAEGVAEEIRLGGGSIGDVSRVTTQDGTRLVRKITHDFDADTNAAHQQDAEVLAPLVARTIGLRAPAVYRVADNEILMAFMDGQLADELAYYEEDLALLKTVEGTRMRLLDLLINNQDRHLGNFLVLDGRIQVIDHGFAFMAWSDPAVPPRWGRPPFVHRPGRAMVWMDNPLTAEDIVVLLRRLESLRPAFHALHRGGWLDDVIERLRAIGDHATGTVRIIE
jgi:hypothetical protein